MVMFGYWGIFTWMPGFLATPVEQGGAGMSIVKSAAWIIPTQIGAFFGYLSFGFISDRKSLESGFVTAVIAMVIASAILFYGMRFAPAIRSSTHPKATAG